MSTRKQDQFDDDVAVATEEKVKVRRPRLYRVLLHNDDYTTMDFVVWVLVRIFNKGEADATRIMLQVHTSGIGVAGVYPRDVAETKVAQAMQEAEAREMPLLVTTEPVNEDE